MTDSGHLWAVGFDGVSRADRVCGEIIKLAERHSLTLLDWTVAVRSLDGSFTVDGEPLLHPIRRGRLANFLASLALGAPPLTSAAVDNFTGGAHSAGCISEDFIREVEDLMQPGTSVLFVVDTAENLNAILDSIRGLGGTVLKTNVDLDRARLIRSALAAPTNHPQGDSKHG
jgi:uncharacterized membrane protein